MRLVEINILPADDAVVATAQITLEVLRGETWRVEKSWVVTAGTLGGKRKILVLDDERLIVQAPLKGTLVYDKENNVVSMKKEESDDSTSGLQPRYVA